MSLNASSPPARGQSFDREHVTPSTAHLCDSAPVGFA
jgi:hypothetical protein